MTTFAITNVLVAVIVENAVGTALKDADDLEKKAETERVQACVNILQVFRAADTDDDQQITAEEFHRALDQPKVRKWLAALSVDIRQAEVLFDILDYDRSG